MARKAFSARRDAFAAGLLALLGFIAALVFAIGGPQSSGQRGLPLVGAVQAQNPAGASSPTASPAERPTRIDRAPVRVLQDPNAAYSAVAVDSGRDEIVLQDENKAYILVYNRTDNTPPTAAMTEPKRMIGGPKTNVSHNCGVYVDPFSGDIYSPSGDIADTMVVFSRQAEGDVPPDRELKTPHRTYGVVVDEQAQELFLTIQHPPAVVVYRKTAKGKDAPLRILEGDQTQLADVYGIALDTQNQRMYVANRGPTSSVQNGMGLSGVPVTGEGEARTWLAPDIWYEYFRDRFAPGSGRFNAPSIAVYPLKASGNTPPLRVIQGSKTQLDWPAHIHLDLEHQEVFVANAMDDSILVFRATDSGNVAPVRVIKGPRTGLKHPHGVFVDEKNQEIVVANFGNHAATVYPRTATGDTAPIRKIRSAPEGTLAPMFGNVGALAYDSKREEILAPN